MAFKIRRRGLITGTGLTLVASALSFTGVGATTSAKVRQRAAIYVAEAPVNRRCSACRLYIPARQSAPSECRVVESPITSAGGCILWEPVDAPPAVGARL